MGRVADLTFQVPETLAGKSFKQLSGDNFGLPLDWYGVPFGKEGVDVGYEAPLSAGQLVKFQTHDPTYQGSGAFTGLQRLLGSPLSQGQIDQRTQQQTTNSALDAAKQLRQFNIESTQPQVSQLEAGTKNLQAKYAEVLASIKGTEQAATEKATLNTANELARRGITGGGFYDTQTSNAALDIARQFAPQKAEVGLKEAESVNEINNAIAALKSGDPQAAIQAALTLSNLGQQASQFQQNFGLQQQSQYADTEYKNKALAQAMDIAKLQYADKPKETDITKNYATLGEGQTLFNLLTGQPAFTAPKTYKQTVSGGEGGSGSGNNSGWGNKK